MGTKRSRYNGKVRARQTWKRRRAERHMLEAGYRRVDTDDVGYRASYKYSRQHGPEEPDAEFSKRLSPEPAEAD